MKTLTLPPNQNANWCHGLPCRAPAGMWSMCRFSTYRRSCSFRAADTAICAHLSLERCLLVVSGMLVVTGGPGLVPAGDQAGGFLGDGQHGGVQGGVGDDRHHRGVGDAQPGDPADPQLRVGHRVRVGVGPCGRCRPGASSCRPCPGSRPAARRWCVTPGPGAASAARTREKNASAGGGLADHAPARLPAGPGRRPSRRKPGLISGAACGSAVASRTVPRLSGATTEATRANPPGAAGARPGRPAAGWGTGAGRASAGQRAAQRGVHLAVVVPAAGQRLGGGVAGQGDGVVLEVLPDAGQVGGRVDAAGRVAARRGRCRTAAAGAASRSRPRTRSPPRLRGPGPAPRRAGS